MLNKRNLRQIIPLALMVFAFFTSCKDETGTLGLDVLPSDDLFKGTDTSSYLPAKNANPDNLRSDDASFAIIGDVNDEYAGKTNATFITQVNIGAYLDEFNQGEDYFVDSLVLNLAYSKDNWFGNKNAKHNVQVHRLTDSLSFSRLYYSDMELEGLYDTSPLSERISSAWDALPDSVWEEDGYIHQWQFRLDQQLAEEIFNFSFPEDPSEARRVFQKELLNGFFIKSEPVDDSRGSLIRLDLLNSKSNMKLYYSFHERDESTNEIDTTKQASYTFPINKECVRVNRFDHDHSNKVEFEIHDVNEFIAQGMAGSMVEIDFNDVEIETAESGTRNLFEFWEEKIDAGSESEEEYYGISAVDVYFKADTILQNHDTLFHSPIPPSLRLYEMNNGNPEEPVYETGQTSEPVANWFIGGSYNDETAEYQFRMAGDYFRMMVQNPELRGPYYLAPPNPISYPWRVILLNDEDVPYLRMKYVSIENP